MTEYNYFCRADDQHKDWYQQAEYRVFNVEVGEEAYNKIKKIYHKLELDENEDYETRYQTALKKMRDWLTAEEQQEYLDIPHFNREGFTYISSITPEDVKL